MAFNPANDFLRGFQAFEEMKLNRRQQELQEQQAARQQEEFDREMEALDKGQAARRTFMASRGEDGRFDPGRANEFLRDNPDVRQTLDLGLKDVVGKPGDESFQIIGFSENPVDDESAVPIIERDDGSVEPLFEDDGPNAEALEVPRDARAFEGVLGQFAPEAATQLMEERQAEALRNEQGDLFQSLGGSVGVGGQSNTGLGQAIDVVSNEIERTVGGLADLGRYDTVDERAERAADEARGLDAASGSGGGGSRGRRGSSERGAGDTPESTGVGQAESLPEANIRLEAAQRQARGARSDATDARLDQALQPGRNQPEDFEEERAAVEEAEGRLGQAQEQARDLRSQRDNLRQDIPLIREAQENREQARAASATSPNRMPSQTEEGRTESVEMADSDSALAEAAEGRSRQSGARSQRRTLRQRLGELQSLRDRAERMRSTSEEAAERQNAMIDRLADGIRSGAIDYETAVDMVDKSTPEADQVVDAGDRKVVLNTEGDPMREISVGVPPEDAAELAVEQEEESGPGRLDIQAVQDDSNKIMGSERLGALAVGALSDLVEQGEISEEYLTPARANSLLDGVRGMLGDRKDEEIGPGQMKTAIRAQAMGFNDYSDFADDGAFGTQLRDAAGQLGLDTERALSGVSNFTSVLMSEGVPKAQAQRRAKKIAADPDELVAVGSLDRQRLREVAIEEAQRMKSEESGSR